MEDAVIAMLRGSLLDICIAKLAARETEWQALRSAGEKSDRLGSGCSLLRCDNGYPINAVVCVEPKGDLAATGEAIEKKIGNTRWIRHQIG